MTRTEYDDTMARARAALAVLRRAAADLSRADAADITAALQHLRDDLHQHGSRATGRPDAPSVAQPERR